jgi:predicted small lipoprotein YifL
MRRLFLFCLVIVSAFALAACGSGGDSGDESEIEAAIEASATSSKPADCKQFNTQKFMEQIARSKGSEAVETCEKEASEENGAKSAAVSNVEVDGSKATADVALTGGSLGGQEVEVALVKEGDQWKLDELTGFAEFDQATVVKTFEEEFAQSKEVSKALASCIADAFEKAPQAKLEDALLSGGTEGFEELAGSCFKEES